MKKHKLDKIQITHVENFLSDMWINSGYFGHEDFENYATKNNYKEIYNLTNHLAKVVVMITPPSKVKSEEKFGFAQKGFEIFELGSYNLWLMYDWWKRQTKTWGMALNFLNLTILLIISLVVACNSC